MKLSMRLRRSTVLGGTVSLLLAGAGAGALYLTPLDLDSQFHAAIGLVQTIHRTASRWAVETSRVRADPTADFDSLSAFVPEVRDMRSAFSETTGSLPLGQQVAADAQAYVDALDALAERVERFKTAYSAIRNSERYLPLASDALVEQALDAGDEQFAQELRSVAGSLAGYVAAPSDADAQRLLVRIQMLSERGPPEPPEGPDALNESLQSYVAHARVVLAERSRLKVHLDAIASSELGRRTEPLVTALEMERIAHRSRVSLWRYGALAAGAGVLVVWVLVGLMRSRPPRRRTPPPPKPAPAPAPGRGDVTHPPAADVAEARTPDIVEAMIDCGVLPGLMGQTFAARTHRLLADLDSVRPAGESAVAPEWARMRNDVRLLDFLAERMTVLGRHLAPKRRTDIDVNAVLTERLARVREVEPEFLAARPAPRIEAPQAEVDLLVDACVEWALHCLRGLAPHDAGLTVTTRPYEAGVELSFIHNGGRLLPEHGHLAFVPFATSRSSHAGLALPAIRYLARRLGGTASLAAMSDGQSRLTVQLPAPGE